MRIAIFLGVFMVLGLILRIVSYWMPPGIAIAVFLVALGLGLYNAIIMVPAGPPPHKAVLLFLGKRIDVFLDEGYRFIPFSPIIFNIIFIKVESVNQDLEEQLVRTPDNALLSIQVSVTWTPHDLNAFINRGREEGVKNILRDIIQDRIRTWAIRGEEGPRTWKEAMGAKEDAVAVILKAVLGDDIESINPNIVPTPTLLRFFSEPQKPPLESEKEIWGGRWETLERKINQLSSSERQSLEETVKRRAKIILKALRGNGEFVHKMLGIQVNKLTVPDIKPLGRVGETADRTATEKIEKEAESIEAEHIENLVKIYTKMGLSPGDAIELIQTERGKVKKMINEGKLNLPSAVLEALQKLLK